MTGVHERFFHVGFRSTECCSHSNRHRTYVTTTELVNTSCRTDDEMGTTSQNSSLRIDNVRRRPHQLYSARGNGKWLRAPCVLLLADSVVITHTRSSICYSGALTCVRKSPFAACFRRFDRPGTRSVNTHKCKIVIRDP